MDLTDLYRGSLEEFVERRTKLARQTRGSDTAAAAAIGKLRKPSLSVWAIDHLGIEHGDLLLELLAAGMDVSTSQRGVAEGVESREHLVIASTRLRVVVESAARAAEAVLATAGHARTGQTGRRIRTTLQSAATGAAGDREALWRGTLDHEVEPTGFGSLDVSYADPPELAEILAPRRRAAPETKHSAPVIRASVKDAHEQHAAAERATMQREEAAQRLRNLAKAKRLHADTLAEQARVANEDATAAEDAADKAEADDKASRRTALQ